jgi:hypothetical protein
MANRTFEPLIVVRNYNGANFVELTKAIPTKAEWERVVRYLLKKGYRLADLDMKYAASGRLASWTWEG